MGPYCKFCGRRCFLPRVLRDGRSMLLATCPRGMAFDQRVVGEDHETALNPVTGERGTPSVLAPAVRRAVALNRHAGAKLYGVCSTYHPDHGWAYTVYPIAAQEAS